jgi:hypothetical protein
MYTFTCSNNHWKITWETEDKRGFCFVCSAKGAEVTPSTDVQQLKTEIAVGLSKIELYISTGRGEYLEDGCNYLRQLSAV